MELDALAELLECPICCDFLRGATETPCCHTVFCGSCLAGWEGANPTCPGCRARLTAGACHPNVPIQRFVDGMAVDCPFRLQGCGNRPARTDLEKHKEMCPFRPELIAEKTAQRLRELEERKERLERLWEALHERGESRGAPRGRKLKGDEGEKEKGTQGVDEAGGVEDLIAQLKDLAKALLHEAAFKDAALMAERAHKLVLEQGEVAAGSLEAAECLALIALTIKEKAEYDRALGMLEEAVAIAGRVEAKEKLAEFLTRKGDILLCLARFREATEAYDEALAIGKEQWGITSPKTAEILNAIGVVAKKCSDYDKAIRVYRDAMNIIGAEGDPAKWCEMALNLADVYRKKASYTEARDLYLKCMAKIELSLGEKHPQLAEVCNALGMLAKKEGHYDEALKYYKKALKISTHLFGKSHPSIGVYLTNLGDVYRKKGDFKKAEGIYFSAIATLEAALGHDHVEVAEALNSMGLVLKKRADYEGARAHYDRAIAIVLQTFGQKHYKVGIYLNNLGDVERKLGNYPKALEIYERALKAIEATLGHTHSEAAEILHNIGLVQHQLGNYDAAIKLYTDALEIVKAEFGPNHYKVGMFLNSSGLARAMLEDYKNAYVELRQSLNILRQCLGAEHVEVADCYANLGDVCMKLHVEAKQGRTSKHGMEGGGDKLEEAQKYYTAANQIVEAALGPDHTKCKQFASLLFICENFAMLSGQ